MNLYANVQRFPCLTPQITMFLIFFFQKNKVYSNGQIILIHKITHLLTKQKLENNMILTIQLQIKYISFESDYKVAYSYIYHFIKNITRAVKNNRRSKR